ncbi:MAG: DoxX family protein [Myxococcales bacterium]
MHAQDGLHVAGDLPPRLALGAAELFHGVSKLKPGGIDGTAGFFENIGLKPGRFWAGLTGVAETFAGACALLGIATRPAALSVLVTQTVAILKVHKPNGYDIAKGGYEYNVALIAIALGLLLAGPGPVSTHAAAKRLARPRGLKRLFSKRARQPLLLELLG